MIFDDLTLTTTATTTPTATATATTTPTATATATATTTPTATAATTFVPSAEQQAEVGKVLTALAAGETLIMLTGSAGTGKTTVLRWLLKHLRGSTSSWVRPPPGDEDGRERHAAKEILLLAPTWKALLNAVARTGHSMESSRTIHSAIYAGPDPTQSELLMALEDEIRVKYDLEAPPGAARKPPLTPKARAEYNAGAIKIRAENKREVSFSAPCEWDYPPGLVVIDEGSMVSKDLYNDLRTALGAKTPMIVIGDYMQLPPIKGVPAFDLENAHGRLRTVHRQAKGSAILDLLTEVRDTRISLHRPAVWAKHGFEVQRVSAANAAQWLAELHTDEADYVAVVARHQTRRTLNTATRRLLGYGSAPCVGERVVFRGRGGLNVDTGGSAFNGEFAYVVAVGDPVPINAFGAKDVLLPVVLDVDGRLVVGVVAQSAWAPPMAKDEGRGNDRTAEIMRDKSREEWRSPAVKAKIRPPAKDAPLSIQVGLAYGACLDAAADDGSADNDPIQPFLHALQDLVELAPAIVYQGIGCPIASGIAVTTWVMQGSQAANVLLVLEDVGWLGDDAPHYWYTAASRATTTIIPVILT